MIKTMRNEIERSENIKEGEGAIKLVASRQRGRKLMFQGVEEDESTFIIGEMAAGQQNTEAKKAQLVADLIKKLNTH